MVSVTIMMTLNDFHFFKLENLWLPEKKYCRLSFLQGILSESKQALKLEQVSQRNIKSSWYEFAIKNVWHLVKNDKELCTYLPSDEMDLGRWPDRKFFWGIVFTVRPAWGNDYW